MMLIYSLFEIGEYKVTSISVKDSQNRESERGGYKKERREKRKRI